MVPDVLQTLPKTAHEELRFESAQRAEHLYERAKLVRSIVVVAAVAFLLMIAAVPTIVGPQGDAAISLSAVSFFCLVGLLISFAHVWSSRVHRDVCCDTYARYIGSR